MQQYFSESYSQARLRFNEASASAGCSHSCYPLGAQCGEELAIDVAVTGRDGDPTIMISSGIHGVEGFFGSAVQLALLSALGQANDEVTGRKGIRYVLVHAVNPFGFAQLRRANEDNVDLNRNFMLPGDAYAGSPPGYAGLDGFFNPSSPPPRYQAFRPKMLWTILGMGLQPLKEAVAGGQYDFPRGIFFGGHGPCESTRIIQENCGAWLGASRQILHLDLHTGLGRSATYKLLVEEPDNPDQPCWYTRVFGADVVEAPHRANRTSYSVSGSFGTWMRHRFSDRDFKFATAEFGTYNLIRVLGAIRAENRAHHHAGENSNPGKRARGELLECFRPNNASWQNKVVSSALAMIERGAQALGRSSGQADREYESG